jgi:GNAT superfamily N-acetyltransferase
MIKVTKCTWADIEAAPNLADLVAEGYEEAKVMGLPNGGLHLEMYRFLDEKGAIKIVKAEIDGELIGYVVVLLHVSMHYSTRLGQVETIFVAKKHRHTGAGLKLIREAENIAQEEKVPVLFFNCPISSAYNELMATKEYEATHTIYCKRFNYATAKAA